MKKVDTSEYISMLRELTDQGSEVQVRISGNSMLPFLADQRDFIYFKHPDRPLRRGDMVVYQRQNGQYIAHRVWKAKPEGVYLVGDAQEQIEGPLSEAQVFGLVTKVQRKGKWIGPGDLWWEFFEHVWVRMVPLRIPVMRLYGLLRRKRE